MAASPLLWSQPCTLSIQGKVNDVHHEDEGLEFATILLEEANKGVVCNEDGTYRLDSLCPGQYHLLVQHLGCESQRLFIQLLSDTIIQIFLEHHSALLDEVVVTENKLSGGTGLQAYTISGNTLQALAGKDLSNIVAQIPGVNILKSGSGIHKPMINGLTGNRIAILNQGIPQEAQQWGNDHAPEIDPFTSQKITVIKGSAAVRYGVNALSGIVILEETPIGEDPHWHGHFTEVYQTNGRAFTSNLSLEKAGKIKFRSILTHRFGGDRSAANYRHTNTGNREYNAAFLVSNDRSDRHTWNVYLSSFNNHQAILRGSHIGNLTDLNDALQRDIPLFTSDQFSYDINAPRQQVGHHLLKTEHKIRWKDESTLSIELAQQWNRRKEFDIRRGGRDSLPSLHLNLLATWADVHLASIGHKFNTMVGTQLKFVRNNNVAGTGILPLIPNYVLTNPAAYASVTMKAWANFWVEAGGRYEYQLIRAIAQKSSGLTENKEKSTDNLALNIGLASENLTWLSVKGNVAFTLRSPLVHELFSRGLHQSLASIEEGNENLQRESSLKTSIDFKLKPFHDGQWSIGLYRHAIDDFIYLAPSGEKRITVRGAFPVFVYQQNDVVIQGIDAMFTQSIHHHWEVKTKFSYTKGDNLETGNGLIYMPPFSTTAEISYLLAQWLGANDLRFNLQYQYTAKQTNVDPKEDFTDTPDAFSLWNLAASFKTKLSKYQFNISITAENLLDTRYRDYLNRQHYFADDLGRNMAIKCQLIF